MFKLNPEPPMDNVADLRKDKLVMWQYRWVHLIGFVAGILVPMGLGWWWNAAHGMNPWIGMLGGFLIPGVARIVVAQHCTFFINSLCHTIGRQPYSSSHSARDSAIMAFLTFGEGYHNYHHEFQHDYRNGVKPWQWDPSKWSIWLLSKVGLTWDLRRVPDGKILLAEMREARKHAEKQLAALEHSAPGLAQRATVAVSDLMEKLTASYHEVEQAVAGKVDLSRRTLRDWQRQTQETVQEISRVLQQVAAQGMSAPSAG
jgi:stearoyl-CoA desaturase (delta-9 desaturase)